MINATASMFLRRCRRKPDIQNSPSSNELILISLKRKQWYGN